MDKKFIANAIRKTRRAADMKQVELAHHIGCSPSYFSELENGKHDIKLELLEKIGAVFNIDYRDFLPPPRKSLIKTSHSTNLTRKIK